MFNDSSVYIFFGENEGLKYADNVKQCFCNRWICAYLIHGEVILFPNSYY